MKNDIYKTGLDGYKAIAVDLGESDIASLIAVGCGGKGGDWLKHEHIKMGGDGGYKAYIVPSNAEIPAHYELVAEFESWLKIYDDAGLVLYFYFYGNGKTAKIYRAGDYGILISGDFKEVEETLNLNNKE